MIGRIYQITSSSTDKIYIGSTSKKLTVRLREHEYDYKKFKNGKYNYVKSYEILENGDYKIVLLEEIENDARTELLEREGYYIKKHRDICVNKCVASRTIKQYCKDNADKIEEVKKQYRKDYADKIKQYRTDNADKLREKRNEKLECVCGKTYTRINKVRHERTKKHIAFNNQ